ncbi:MAG TPA: DUF4872 domain-containing protein, partial [Gemmataceae bacterium]|nr:DUF4872 domain-containing protein [Gemmataceae bacterium]
MTAQKHLKERVRARMSKTGESYAAARRQVLRLAAPLTTDPATRWHFPGNVPATTALRTLLAHAGVKDPHTGKPFSEAMLFGLAGGIGIGVCSFYYAKGNIATFFLAGRHLWQDHVAYFRGLLGRLGIKPILRETSGAKTAEQQLRDALQEGPCIAWVDGYRIIAVYALRDDHALIGNLADEPTVMPLGDLAATRLRIKKQKNRLLSVPPSGSPNNLEELVRAGLRECQRGLMQKPKGMPGFFTLDSLRTWGERLHASKGKQAWETIFAPGPNLWRGLTSIYDFIEHHGTGGGLCRPLFADFLQEASEALGDACLSGLAERYAELGRQWTALAEAALLDSVPLLREAKH